MDEKLITGESLPVGKRVGDKVWGGTTNCTGGFKFEVKGEGMVDDILKCVQEAQTNRAPIERIADRVGAVFAPCVIFFSLITLTVWLTLGNTFFTSFLRAVAVMVAACPCALGLATPTAVMVGCGVGASNGILVKGGAVLEETCKVDAVVFDKTGTLTTGEVAVEGIRVNEEGARRVFGDGGSMDFAAAILRCASRVESGSEHPLAKSIVRYAENQGVRGGGSANNFDVAVGCGVEGNVDGLNVKVGKGSWVIDKESYEGKDKDGVGGGASRSAGIKLLEETGVHVSINNIHVAVIKVSDGTRPDAAEVISTLKSTGIDVYCCTGDSEAVAREVAREVDISFNKIYAGALPEDKGNLVERLREEGKVVMFVGDGINDAIALTKANVGMAIGSGTQMAVESADIALMRENLTGILLAIDLATVVFRRIRMNYFWAVVYNICMLPAASGLLFPLTGWVVPPAVAGLAMAMSSISVVCSSLMLKRYKFTGEISKWKKRRINREEMRRRKIARTERKRARNRNRASVPNGDIEDLGLLNEEQDEEEAAEIEFRTMA